MRRPLIVQAAHRADRVGQRMIDLDDAARADRLRQFVLAKPAGECAARVLKRLRLDDDDAGQRGRQLLHERAQAMPACLAAAE